MFKRFKNIRIGTLLIHLLVTLAYPVVKALMSSGQRLLIFTDILTIIAMALLIIGVICAAFIHGDFDISGFFIRRGIKKEEKGFQAFEADMKEKREAVFNYPLFLGLVYLIVVLVIAYGIY